MKVYFVRHGETAKNREKRLQGRSSEPLSPAGIRQAEEARAFFRKKGITFDLVFSSPLKRAVQTADIITDGMEICLDPRLQEMDYGPYEGMSLEEPSPEVVHFFRDFRHHPAPDGMESLQAVTERLREFLEDLSRCEKETVLVATHAIALKGALEVLEPNGTWWSTHVGNCTVYRVTCTRGAYGQPEAVFNLKTGSEASIDEGEEKDEDGTA